MSKKKKLTFTFEQKKIRKGFSFVIGCDEVGRGCLAGPVVAVAIALKPLNKKDKAQVESYKNINDSKVLSETQRELTERMIKPYLLCSGIGVVSEKVVDEVNIHNASLLAMRKAVENLVKSVACESKKIKIFVRKKTKNIFLVVDGKFLAFKADDVKIKIMNCGYNLVQEALVGADGKIISVAAASVVAKVYRDKLMKKMNEKFPEYGFAKHKGYATFHHREAIKKFGLTVKHRRTFCKKFL